MGDFCRTFYPCASKSYATRSRRLNKTPRRNGFSCPPSPYQVGLWLTILYLEIVLQSAVIPLFPKQWRIYLYATNGCAFVVHVILHIWILSVNPAHKTVVKNWNHVNERGKRKTPSQINDEHCYVCDVAREDSTEHCGKCNKCIPDFHHHCSWINGCVGGKNFKLFLFVTLSGLVCIALEVTFLGTVTVLHFLHSKWIGNKFSILWVKTLKEVEWIAIIMVANVLSFLLLCILLVTLFLHIYYMLKRKKRRKRDFSNSPRYLGMSNNASIILTKNQNKSSPDLGRNAPQEAITARSEDDDVVVMTNEVQRRQASQSKRLKREADEVVIHNEEFEKSPRQHKQKNEVLVLVRKSKRRAFRRIKQTDLRKKYPFLVIPMRSGNFVANKLVGTTSSVQEVPTVQLPGQTEPLPVLDYKAVSPETSPSLMKQVPKRNPSSKKIESCNVSAPKTVLPEISSPADIIPANKITSAEVSPKSRRASQNRLKTTSHQAMIGTPPKLPSPTRSQSTRLPNQASNSQTRSRTPSPGKLPSQTRSQRINVATKSGTETGAYPKGSRTPSPATQSRTDSSYSRLRTQSSSNKALDQLQQPPGKIPTQISKSRSASKTCSLTNQQSHPNASSQSATFNPDSDNTTSSSHDGLAQGYKPKTVNTRRQRPLSPLVSSSSGFSPNPNKPKRPRQGAGPPSKDNSDIGILREDSRE